MGVRGEREREGANVRLSPIFSSTYLLRHRLRQRQQVRDALAVLDLLRLEAVVLGREAQRVLALVVEEELCVRDGLLQLTNLLVARPRLPPEPVELGVLGLRGKRGEEGGNGKVGGW